MRVKLIEKHIIGDSVREAGEILDIRPDQVSPLMNPLDDEAREAIAAERLRVWGRFENTPPGFQPLGPLIDDPPIPRPLDGENRPVFHYSGRREYLQGVTGTPGFETPSSEDRQ